MFPGGHAVDTGADMPKITDALVKSLEPPAGGNRITYDDEIKGFGIRVTAAGAKAFVVTYRAAGRQRRITIGSYPDWKVAAARDEAARIKREVDRGNDPMGERHAERAAPTVAELGERYLEEHGPRKREMSLRDDKAMITKVINPAIGAIKVEAVKRSDIADLHRKMTARAPIRANRVLALLSKMFSLANAWEIRDDNPAKGIERNPEERRERYLKPAELLRLTEALNAHGDQASANIVRLLLLTGARRGEVLNATWAQFDLEEGVWTKPSATTKQKRVHRVPLNAPALALLVAMHEASLAAREKALKLGRASQEVIEARAARLFPGLKSTKDAAQGDLKKSWAAICKAADLDCLRLHDLRHSYASFLASAGLSLPVIGALLGHTQPATTARYAHLLDDPLRQATERVGAIVTAGARQTAEVVAMERKRG